MGKKNIILHPVQLLNVYFTKVIYRTPSGLFWHHRGSLWLFSTLYVLLRLLSSKHVSVSFSVPVVKLSCISLQWNGQKEYFQKQIDCVFFFLYLLILCLWTEISFLVLSMSRKSSPYWLMPHLTLLAFYWFEPPTLPSPDSCLFSPTLIRDLIEGNHSDKKPPILLCVCVGVCVWVGGRSSASNPSNPTTSPPLSLSPPPLKCHAALSTRLPYYPPNKLFVWHWEEALRLRESEKERDMKKRQASFCCWLVPLCRTSGSTSLTSGDPECFQKRSTFNSS